MILSVRPILVPDIFILKQNRDRSKLYRKVTKIDEI